MAQNGFGGPVSGHAGRIPIYGKTQVNPMGSVEPPACIQNAMMTKDKKPFTYTPGGLDLSQIKTPSMARRLARQRSQEEQEQAYAQQHANGGANYQPQGNYHPQGGPAPPPPPPMNVPAPPPPPPLVIPAPTSKSPKPNTLAPGERPEIVIPENPIGMLRKTHSPYHWEAEKAEKERMGGIPKFVEKVPSPLTVQMPPTSFSQQPPQSYVPQNNSIQRQNYPHSNQAPESPLHKPEPQYVNQNYSPVGASPPTRELLQRQDSQFNKSPLPFAGQSPVSHGSPFSPSPNSTWRQPDKRDSPVSPQSPLSRNQFSPNVQQYSPNQSQISPQSPIRNQFSPNVQQHSPNQSQASPQAPLNRNQFSPNVQQYPCNQSQTSPHMASPAFNTLPRTSPRAQDNYAHNTQNKNVTYNNVNQARPQSPKIDPANPTPWRTNTLNRQSREVENPPSIYHNSQPLNQQAAYTPPWQKSQETSNNQIQNPPSHNQDERRSQGGIQNQYNAPGVKQDSNNNNGVQDDYCPPWKQQNNKPTQSQTQDEARYQSNISIPVSARKPKPENENNNTPPQREVVFVNQEPVYYCPDSPKAMPGFVKAQKEKTKTPPPIWCQRPLEGGRKSVPRELVTPPRDSNQEPEWVKLSTEMQRNVREVVSPPRYQQPQPTWSTRPSENRKSLPKDNPQAPSGHRVVPIQIDTSNSDQGRQGQPHPQLRITIGVNPNENHQTSQGPQGPYSQPTQRIMRVLSPQLVRMDDGPSMQQELPTLNRNLQNNQVKERIIPIQIEGGGSNGANKRVYYHKFTQEAPPRQSKAFRVLQVITGTQDQADLQGMENQHGFTDL